MFPKLLSLVLAAGLMAACLLALRQQRLEASHAMSVVHERIVRKERVLWALRSEIAQRCRAEEVRRMMRDLDHDWTVIPAADETPRGVKPIALFLNEFHDEPGPATTTAVAAGVPDTSTDAHRRVEENHGG